METATAPMTFDFSLHPLDWAVIATYVVGIVLLGVWFGRFTKNTNDFFLGGQRFSWWVGSIACVATLIGSYSFMQYAQNGFNYGLASMTAYTNDWFVLPLFLLVWLPIVYYNRLTSIPEYFERRFDRRTRLAVLIILVIYLQGYIGFNLYSIGLALQSLLGGPLILWAAVIAALTAVVIYAGGATSVMMADLLQAALLLAAGLIVFLLGIHAVGGFAPFWDGLSTAQQLPFAQFNSPKEFHFVGDFWSDAITGTIAFYFINQGVLMRVMSVKSVWDARKTMLFTVVVLMPLAAVAVSGAGWVGRALVSQGVSLGQDSTGKDVFIRVVGHVCAPGLFGFVMAALLAALMSTLEALINALSAVAVNDVWRPYLKPGRPDAYYLRVARYVAVAGYLVGLLLIPLFAPFGSIYEALTHFNAVVVPPMVVVIVLGVIWKRFTPAAAYWTLVLGAAALLVSLFVPALITPFAHGEPIDSSDPTWRQYSYMRSLFGLVVSGAIGVTLTFLTKPKPDGELTGLVISSIPDAMRRFKGGEPNQRRAGVTVVLPVRAESIEPGTARLPLAAMDTLAAEPGDLLYISDDRWWLGGLRSIHVRTGEPTADGIVRLCSVDLERGQIKLNRSVRVQKTM
jgi:SSS family solute:Na+ symporter